MDQVIEVSTPFGVVTLLAALESGLLEPPSGRRVLVTSVNATIPEAAPPASSWPGIDRLSEQADEVVSWNDLVAPLHPGAWDPRPHDLVVLGRLLRDRWGLRAEQSELVVESIHVAPADALTRILDTARITVYAEGLMSYGPTRSNLPPGVLRRVERLLSPDLLPPMQPALLQEVPRASVPIDAKWFTSVLESLPVPAELAALRERIRGQRAALVLGQYVSALGLLSTSEEAQLYGDIMRRLAQSHDHVVLKAHPNTPPELLAHLETSLTGQACVSVLRSGLAESAFQELSPDLVAGCFSTGLATARELYGLPVATLGTDLLLNRLDDPANSNRLPLTAIDATVPRIRADGSLAAPPLAPEDVELAMQAVAFDMQPGRVRHFAEAERVYRERQDRGAVPQYLRDPRTDTASADEGPRRWRRHGRRLLSRARGRVRQLRAGSTPTRS